MTKLFPTAREQAELAYYGIMAGEQSRVFRDDAKKLVEDVCRRYGMDASVVDGCPVSFQPDEPIIQVKDASGTRAMTFMAVYQQYALLDPLDNAWKIVSSPVTCPTCHHTNPGPEMLTCQICKQPFAVPDGGNMMTHFRYQAVLHRQECK